VQIKHSKVYLGIK